VQYKLLKLGIDSARMTTDAGIDLVVYSPGDRSATTVQVKSNRAPKPAGGTGPLSRGWYFPDDSPADMVALVALDADMAWLMTLKEARELAQQHSARGMRQIYWRVQALGPAQMLLRHEAQMCGFLLETRAPDLFP